ncbi:diaminopimelate dehydrogenase [Oribacterium sp. WCC10]|uniref:diaminopimelate dehydrogenase n=1 Tax=Oribacterium sp. WCC10 TaxID=1855343 RepID=UPI0008ECCDB2|nr:diaminopimelate dehydrogenase [Oribacterium sp. WCC10]SFG31751.1 diaminopimelate dehydrogenase [Oribacterium sp. WCC10]
MIRIGLLGYGNLSRGIESAIKRNEDEELVAVFTRRDPSSVKINTEGVKVDTVDNILNYKDQIDVLMICGGSATDLPKQTPEYAKYFNVIDSFDTHARIPQHFAAVDESAKNGGKLAMISCGWDPGMFSIARIYAESVLPEGKHYTFWGKGVSQGHSDAARRVPGVKDARSYTLPVEEAMDAVRNGQQPEFTARQMHKREVFVVLEDGADAAKVEETIKTMPDYYADYDVTIHFISEEEMKKEHAALPHGGFVMRSGVTGNGQQHEFIEYSLKLDSNPEFTGSVLAAYARAVDRMSKKGETGCITVFDVAPKYLNPKSEEEQRHTLL